jgi:hypothetical protein
MFLIGTVQRQTAYFERFGISLDPLCYFTHSVLGLFDLVSLISHNGMKKKAYHFWIPRVGRRLDGLFDFRSWADCPLVCLPGYCFPACIQ